MTETIQRTAKSTYFARHPVSQHKKVRGPNCPVLARLVKLTLFLLDTKNESGFSGFDFDFQRAGLMDAEETAPGSHWIGTQPIRGMKYVIQAGRQSD